MLVQRHAAHEFHDQEVQAVLRAAAIQNARDARMIHAREQLSLRIDQRLGETWHRADELDRHRLLEQAVVAARPVDRAHAARADQFIKPIDPDLSRRNDSLRIREPG